MFEVTTAATSKIQKMLGALALASALCALSAAALAPSSAVAGPPGSPGTLRPGPGFGPKPGFFRPSPPPHFRPAPAPGLRPAPGFRPAPPPHPRPGYRPRPRYGGWGFWGPALTIGAVVGTEIYRDPVRIVEVPSTTVVVPQAAPSTDSKLGYGSYPWYWCSSEQGYYPNVLTCPLGWKTVLGTSAVTPPAPPPQ